MCAGSAMCFGTEPSVTRVIGVATAPGHTQLIWIRRPFSGGADARTRPTTAHFVIE